MFASWVTRGNVASIVAAILILNTVLITPAQETKYIVGPNDVLTVSLWDQTELSGKFIIEGDGTFGFPMIGRVKASGLTLPEIESELKKRLADGFFKNPQLSVSVEQYRSQQIFIVGEVKQPGPYPLNGDMTLIEAFARAGAATHDAAGHVLIVRALEKSANGSSSSDPTPDILQVNLRELVSGSPSGHVRLRDGDTIFVPRAESIYVFGQVRSPGTYPIKPETTVLQALSLAGGVSERGSTTRIRIVRVAEGKKAELKVNLGDLVQGGDTIIVQERFF